MDKLEKYKKFGGWLYLFGFFFFFLIPIRKVTSIYYSLVYGFNFEDNLLFQNKIVVKEYLTIFSIFVDILILLSSILIGILLVKKYKNAIFYTKVFLIAFFLSHLLLNFLSFSLLFSFDMSIISTYIYVLFVPFLFTIFWLLYFKYSKRIEVRYQ